jgi:hypothetical protein
VEAALRTALATFQKRADDHPAVAEFRHNLAFVHRRFVPLLLQTGKLAEAEAALRTALAIQQKLAGDDPDCMSSGLRP